MTLRPTSSTSSNSLHTEYTGSAANFPSIFEEGNEPIYPNHSTPDAPHTQKEDETIPDINQDDDSSSDESQSSIDEMQGYTKPLEYPKEQLQNENQQLEEQDILPQEHSNVRTSSRIKKRVTRFEEDPETYNCTMQSLKCQNYYNKRSKKSC